MRLSLIIKCLSLRDNLSKESLGNLCAMPWNVPYSLGSEVKINKIIAGFSTGFV